MSGKCSKCATHPVTVGIIVAHKMLKRSLARTTEWIYSSDRLGLSGNAQQAILQKNIQKNTKRNSKKNPKKSPKKNTSKNKQRQKLAQQIKKQQT